MSYFPDVVPITEKRQVGRLIEQIRPVHLLISRPSERYRLVETYKARSTPFRQHRTESS